MRKKILKDKKAELLVNETLKIILSVIAIGFLVFFLTSLYFSRIYDKEFLSAKSTIKRISDVVAAEGGEVDALTPKGWSIFSFAKADKPNSCLGQSCLCLCKPVSSLKFWTSQLKECNSKGVCTIVPGMISFKEIKITEELTNIMIEKHGGNFIIYKK